mgnify:FL=1|jgi:hypothetical protein
MINIILTYILIGVVFATLFDLLANNLESTPTLQKAMDEWGVQERIMCILMWPLAFLVFIWSFLTVNKNK